MKSIVKHIETMERLIHAQEAEIMKLRFLVARYHVKHGEEIHFGQMILCDEEDFVITDKGDKKICQRISTRELGITNNYQNIQRMLEELE